MKPYYLELYGLAIEFDSPNFLVRTSQSLAIKTKKHFEDGGLTKSTPIVEM